MLRLISLGVSTKSLAQRLGITLRAALAHVENVLRMLDAGGRHVEGAAAWHALEVLGRDRSVVTRAHLASAATCSRSDGCARARSLGLLDQGWRALRECLQQNVEPELKRRIEPVDS
jgi:hypothetical protein